MAVFRVERTRDYTVMSNYHLKDGTLSLKSKGLLAVMLSLPDEWNYSTRGLAAICKEGVDAIGAALKELETAGYIIRHQLRGANGRITDTEYVIYEQPQKRLDTPLPDTDLPDTENPYLDKPDMENREELNTKVLNKKQENTEVLKTHSIPFRSEAAAASPPEANGSEAMFREMELYRAVIRENIDYDILLHEKIGGLDRLDEIVELMTETVCSKRKTIRVAGSDFPHEVVKSRLLGLNSEHIRFVFDCLNENTSKVRNIKQYLLTTLFNAPTTIGNYYSSLVNHDMYGSE